MQKTGISQNGHFRGFQQKESVIQRHILEYLRSIGATAGKTKTMGVMRRGRWCCDPMVFRGFPDITFFYKGKLYFCEVKSATGKQSREQLLFSILCAEANISYILARSFADVQTALNLTT